MFDRMNRRQKYLKGALVIGDDDYVLVEDVHRQPKDYTSNQVKLEGRVYVKRAEEYVVTEKTFKVKLDDDVLSVDVVDSRPGQVKVSLGGVRNRECEKKKDCFGNGVCQVDESC